MLKLRAERRAGELLAEMPKAKGAATPKDTRSHDATALDDIGITKSDSSRWQAEAKVAEVAS